MGVNLIEKHFTIGKHDEGPDHAASLSPNELNEFVKRIKQVDTFMGSSLKFPNLSETLTRKSLQKCLVANKNIKVGDMFTSDNIVAKRTGGEGISPIYVDEIYGLKSNMEFIKDDIINI